jgi:tRNA A-37 threonylcarbamoyl transferase component Bud32
MLPIDPVIRHLRLAMDVDRIKALLQQSLLNSGFRNIHQCQIERIKYKPAKNCLVCYRLTIVNSQTQASEEALLCARFYGSGESQSRFLKAKVNNKSSRLAYRCFIAPVLHLSELDCVIWVFPNDRKLKSLALLNDEKQLKQVMFPSLVKQYWGDHWNLIRLHSERIHYLPEHTCCVRTQLVLKNTQTSENAIQLLYGKTYYNNQGSEAFKVMTQLWDSDLRKQGLLAIPQPVVYLPDQKVLWQYSVPGRPVLDWVKTDPSFYQRFDEIAGQVAALHQSRIKVEQQISRTQLCQKLNEVVTLTSCVKPTISQILQPLVTELASTDITASMRPEAILHGDLHLKNMLADESQIYLIDLDDIHRGDPLQDIASLIAAILSQSVIQVFSETDAQRMIQLFLYHYQHRVLWEIDTQALRWYVAVALINERVSRSISRLKDGRLDNLDNLVTLAAEIFLSSYAPVWCKPACCETVMEVDCATR